MATLSAHVAFNMDNWNLGDPADGYLGSHDNDHFRVKGDHHRTYDFGGHGFDYFGFGPFAVPVDGHVQTLTIAKSGATELAVTGIDIDIPTMYGFFAADQFDAMLAYIFSGDDTLTGSGQADVLKGFTGDDKISGGGSADRLEGGIGADRVTGGAGGDAFMFDSALDSTSIFYDRIADFDASLDVFVFDDAVTAVDATVGGGRLSARRFDLDLSHAADDAHLGAHHAVLFTPDAGKHSGETFLIVDLNGDAGYQIGEDAVMRLDDASHLAGFGAGNFELG